MTINVNEKKPVKIEKQILIIERITTNSLLVFLNSFKKSRQKREQKNINISLDNINLKINVVVLPLND